MFSRVGGWDEGGTDVTGAYSNFIFSYTKIILIL